MSKLERNGAWMIRVPRDYRSIIQAVAKKEGRNVNGMAQTLFVEGLKARGIDVSAVQVMA